MFANFKPLVMWQTAVAFEIWKQISLAHANDSCQANERWLSILVAVVVHCMLQHSI